MRLTLQEKLIIVRERKGLTQAEMAKKLGIDPRHYARYETQPLERYHAMNLMAKGADLFTVRQLKPGERCFIMRRRCGSTQAEVAKALGCCRRWVMLMEKGKAPADDLLWYWEN